MRDDTNSAIGPAGGSSTTQGEDLILAAVCVYLLLGGLFTALNGVVVTLPVSAWARSLAILQTVVGTLFIATVIARLVGVYSSWRPASSETPASTTREGDQP